MSNPIDHRAGPTPASMAETYRSCQINAQSTRHGGSGIGARVVCACAVLVVLLAGCAQNGSQAPDQDPLKKAWVDSLAQLGLNPDGTLADTDGADSQLDQLVAPIALYPD